MGRSIEEHPMKLPRKKKCKSCGKIFQPERPIQPCCSISCAINLANEQKSKRAKKEKVEFKRKFLANDRSHQKKLAQKYFNRYIRLRDAGLPCIACGRHHKGQIHASHYRSVGSQPALRFNELNCHAGCMPCNTHLSGNLIAYRVNLIEKIGIGWVEWLEIEHQPKKYSIEELISVKEKYLKKCKEFEG